MKRIERKDYLDRLINLKDVPIIKVITGVRRSGKSFLIEDFSNYIKKQDPKANVVYIKMQELDNDELSNYKKLHDYIVSKYDEKVKNYLFVDEIQLCNKFEHTINSIHSKGIYDIYVTGSNAFLLSSDLATLFTGRYIEIEVFPFSFKEYLKYFDKYKDFEKAFDDYVIKGGFSGTYLTKNEKDRKQYINNIFETIVERDLVQKYNLPDTTAIKQLSDYLMNNISNIVSPNRITGSLLKEKVQTNHTSISNYINYLCNAFIFYKVKRYDIKGKEYLSTLDKYYLVDTGLRFSRLGTNYLDYGRTYENIVAIELMRRGYEIYIGKLYQKEIDFVAVKDGSPIYIQVADNISEEKTFKREYEPLLQIKNAYPKYIIARTKHDDYSYDGIIIEDIANWLIKY